MPLVDPMRLLDGIASRLLFHARLEAPRECVGVLLGRGHTALSIQPLANLAHTPGVFSAALRTSGYGNSQNLEDRDIIAIYHSHPTADLVPSMVDSDGWPNAKWLCVLVSPRLTVPAIRAYQLQQSKWLEVPIRQSAVAASLEDCCVHPVDRNLNRTVTFEE